MASSGEDSDETEDPLHSIIRSQRILLGGLVRSVRKGDGITLQQAALLRILFHQGPTSMKKLSEELLVTPPNITGIVDRLERKRLVARVPGLKDRRKTEIQLTPKGNALRKMIGQDYAAYLGSALTMLTGEEQSTLAKLLRKLADNARNA